MDLRAASLKLLLRLARLPQLRAPEERPAFAEAADELLRPGAAAVEIPEPRLEFFQWLAVHRDVVFHGSPRDDLTELSTERRSKDATEWGNQQAVYATTDPVWALYFATLRRDDGWTGTRNGSMGAVGGPLYPRRYLFAHNRGARPEHRFQPGSLYLLPPDTFEAEPPLAGVIDTAHLVSRVPVKPIARVDVTPADFPFRNRVGSYRDREPIWITLFRG